MKKILIAAALVASIAVPSSSFAAGAAPAAAMPKPVCYLLPLLPDCLSAWKADNNAFWHKVSAKPKTAKVAVIAPAVPKMPKMPTCAKAAAGAGHLYDCKM